MSIGAQLKGTTGKRKLGPTGKRQLVAGTGSSCGCCADPTTPCPHCDEPTPTDWDMEFTGITTCPGSTALSDTTPRVGPLTFPISPEQCYWEWEEGPDSDDDAAAVEIRDDGGTVKAFIGAIAGGLTCYSDIGSAYGPDCTAMISSSNALTSCPPLGSKAGVGGSATATAVLPP